MSIKDNFSQAVKELWKKDGQSEQGISSAPSELERYLKQQNGEQPSMGENNQMRQNAQPQQTTPAQQPNQGQPQQNPQGQPMQNMQNMQNTSNAPNMQAGSEMQQPMSNMQQQNPQSMGMQGQQNQQGGGYNRQGGYNNSGYGGAQGYGGYDTTNGGYRQPPLGSGGAPYSQSSGSGFGGYVPPVPGDNLPQQQSGETDEVTVISKNTIIDGNVRSLANMQINGNIKGNVETTRNVDMTGKIVGDITCNNAGMVAAAMQGNVSLKGRIRMDRDTILIGDLSSQYADINGRIRGKLDIAGKAELKRDAIVFGDINASTIAVTDGAIIQGYVNTTFLSKEDSRNAIPEAISLDGKDNNT